MYSESPLASPEDVACYEECVTDEAARSSSPTLSSKDVPKSSSGRVTKKGRSKARSLKERKCSSPMVLKWLEENYEEVPGACLPRSVLYTHYQDFCKRNYMEPSSAASFGKIIRLKFPDLQTRRLGTRGQSKYHYHGLAIKETSVYYRSVYSKKGLTRFSGATLKRENGQLYNPSSKTGILLPDFPQLRELNFMKPFPLEKVETFLLMYRAHCQRILDSVVRANFHEVQDFLIHFWQGMPTHMLPILGCQATVDLVVVCDFVLYRTLCEVLIPATLQPLPDNLLDEVVRFSHTLVEWLFTALQDLPAALGIRKVQTAELFGKSLRRQTALVQLAKGARTVLRNTEAVSGILQEWRSIDFDSLSSQASYGQPVTQTQSDTFKEFATELEQLFVKQSSLEVYFEWLDSLLERRVSEPTQAGGNQVELSQDFLLVWNCFYNSVEKEIALLQGKSFDAFRTLQLVLDEYVNHVVEMLQSQTIEQQYNDVLKVHGIPSPHSAVHTPLPTPVFPPTPDHTPNPGDREFFRTFESAITTELQDCNSFFTGALPSPGFTALPDSFCDGFFKQEYPSFRPSCSHVPTPLRITESPDGMPPPPFVDSTPLTPQSSHYSTSSPLSHCSLQSPGAASEAEFGGSHASNSPHNLPTSMTNSMYVTTSPTPNVVSPHMVAATHCSFDIAASLNLVAEGCAAMPALTSAYQDYAQPVHSYSDCSQGPPMTAIVQVPPAQTYSNYSQYDFELLQLMSNPDDLLADPFCPQGPGPKDPRAFIQSPPPSTPIH